MASFSPEAARLIALSGNGNQEQLFSLLQNDAMLRTALGSETINPYPDSAGFEHMKVEHFVLERMIEAAAGNGDADLLSALIAFGAHHGVAMPYMVNREILCAALTQNKNLLELLLALERVHPNIFHMRIHHNRHILQVLCGSDEKESKAAMPLLRHMLQMGFNPNFTGRSDGTGRPVLLHSACRAASCEMIECLLDSGAVIDGARELRVAASEGRINVMEVLLKYGADLNKMEETKDEDGPAGTALHVATAHGQAEAVRWLAEKGADSTLKSCDGLTAKDLACGAEE